MKRYAASYYCKRVQINLMKGVHIEMAHQVDILDANNPDEAVGKGHRNLQQLYPKKDGWDNYSVKVMLIL